MMSFKELKYMEISNNYINYFKTELEQCAESDIEKIKLVKWIIEQLTEQLNEFCRNLK
jgi:hypothetical protein